MKSNCIKFAIVITCFAFAANAQVQTPTPTPTPTPFVAPPLPSIVQTEKPVVFSFDPAKLPAPYHTESARRPSKVVP